MKLVTKAISTDELSFDDSAMTISGWMSCPTVDTDGDVVDGSAFDLTIHKQFPYCHWAHNTKDTPAGKFEDESGNYTLKVKSHQSGGNGLFGTIHFAPTEKGREIYKLYRTGFLKGFSAGFIANESRKEKIGGQMVTRYTRATLREVSAVPMPANLDCIIVNKAMHNGEEVPAFVMDEIKKSFAGGGILTHSMQNANNDSESGDIAMTTEEIQKAISEGVAAIDFSDAPAIKELKTVIEKQATEIAQLKTAVAEQVKWSNDAEPKLAEVTELKTKAICRDEYDADTKAIEAAIVGVSEGKRVAVA